jgi:hypothetical protein
MLKATKTMRFHAAMREWMGCAGRKHGSIFSNPEWLAVHIHNIAAIRGYQAQTLA